MALRIAPGSKWVFIGDSITDCGRGHPIGQGGPAMLGQGYVLLADMLLTASYPGANIQVVNMGIGGNTVRHLKERWQTDVLNLQPDWLSIMIGTNDVWRQFDCPDQPEIHVLPEEFVRTYDELIESVQGNLKGLILATPFYVQADLQDPMRVRMDEYSAMVREIAKRHGALLVDTQAAFDEMLEYAKYEDLAEDRIHPSLHGHTTLTRAFLNSVDFEL